MQASQAATTAYMPPQECMQPAYEHQIADALKELDELKIALNAHAIVVITDAKGVITQCNDKFCLISQYSRDELIGKTHRVINSGHHPQDFFQHLWKTISSGKIWNDEVCNRAKDGSLYWVHTTIVPFIGEHGKPRQYIAIRADITQRKQAEQRVYHLALHDALTDLPNRALLSDRLQQALDCVEKTGQHGALMLLDLDNFKDINDRLGHDMGDNLLRQVAVRLSDCVRAEDTVARMGGDEFVILFNNLESDITLATAQANVLAQKVRRTLDKTFKIGNLQIRCTCSIGLVLFNNTNRNKTELMIHADMAMYKAKDHGRNTAYIFDTQLQTEVMDRSTLIHDLQEALRRDEFYLYYQCIVNQHRRPQGFEALVRWQHPTQGLLSPGAFIELAEQSGLIVPLGQWVLEAACKQLEQWSQNSSTAHWTMAVNVSARQFQDARFVSKVRDTLRRTKANPSLLYLELTESIFLTDIEKNILKMQELRALDVRFALDDFGTGYSSLSHLKRLPLDTLKVDASFVQGLPNDTDDVAITATILALARTLELQVVAEGVETEAQFNCLRQQGCNNFQGYLFAKPMPGQDATDRYSLAPT